MICIFVVQLIAPSVLYQSGLQVIAIDYILNIRQILMPIKSHQAWNVRSDNSKVTSGPSEQQVSNISYYCHNYGEYYQHFIMTCYQIAPTACLSALTVVQDKEQFNQLLQEIAEAGYVLLDTISDFTSSYKGWLSWIVVGFNNKGYLIDALILHHEIRELKLILENRNIVKFIYRQCILLQDAKREWSAFGVNFFDFQLFQKSIGVNKALNIFPHQLSQRPIANDLMEELQERYNNMVKYLAQIRYYLEKQSSDYSIYGYSNHYELLLKEQRHLTYSFEQEQKEYAYFIAERKRRLRDDKENNFSFNTSGENQDYQKDVSIKNQRDRNLCELFINWREHMARIIDCPPRELLTFHQIAVIADEKPTSILEVQDILSKDRIQTFELASKILQILAYEAEMNENLSNELQVRTNRRRQDKNFKSLLSELKWEDRQEWLNRRNDESIRLYKEIVSIVELDGSVIEQFTEGMNKGPVSKAQIGRFVKYAQYLRNGNHRRLKEFYESLPPLESGSEKQDQLEGWSSDEDCSFIVNKNAINSLTSIADSLEKLPEKVESNTSSTLKGTNSCFSFAEELELGAVHTKIEPLPQNIEEIYLKAVSVKKGYQKVQKKKGGRKQGKQQSEQFVPTWDNIKQLLQI